MKQIKLTKKELEMIPKSFDVVGDILIFSAFPKELIKKQKLVGQKVIDELSNVKVVVKKSKIYSGKYRTPKLTIIAGEKRKTTTYKEHGCRFNLDVEKCYFSPRLSTERKRVFNQIKKGEKVLVLFSGVGPYPIDISKNTSAKEVFGIEMNPEAHKYAVYNVVLNKAKNVYLFKGDVNKVLPKIKFKFDRIIMPLPKTADDFLKTALKASKKGTIINFYTFEQEAKIKNVAKMIKQKCKSLKKSCRILRTVKCGQYSPRVFRVCVDFKVN